MGEFDLSEKRIGGQMTGRYYIYEDDVKAFINIVKEEIKAHIAGSEKFYDDNPENLLDFIDRKAGKHLIK